MAGAKGLEDCTWDSASCAFLRWGATKVPVQKFTPSKVEIKREKVRRVGEQVAGKRTPGAGEVTDATAEILATDYEEFVLPRLGLHAGSDIEFVITQTATHPTVRGSLGTLLDHVSIVSIEGPELDGSEKPQIIKLGLSVMDRWDKGRDGKWKALYRKSTMTSSDAQAQLQF